MHGSRRPIAVASAIAAGVFALACASGGGPGVKGPEAQALFHRYSGEWVLDVDASDSIPAQAPGQGAGRGGAGGQREPGTIGGAGGGDFGGGGRGGRGGGGGARGGGRGGAPGGAQGGGQTPEGIRGTMRLGSDRWQQMTLALDDSTFVVIPGRRGRGITLSMSGDEIEDADGGSPFTSKLKWEDGRPAIERSIDGGGKIVDLFEMVGADRLLVTRTFNAGRGDREFRFVYNRRTGPSTPAIPSRPKPPATSPSLAATR